MSVEDVEYYRRRALQERELANQAINYEAAKAHEELARLYEGLVKRVDYLPSSRVPDTSMNGVERDDLTGTS